MRILEKIRPWWSAYSWFVFLVRNLTGGNRKPLPSPRHTVAILSGGGNALPGPPKQMFAANSQFTISHRPWHVTGGKLKSKSQAPPSSIQAGFSLLELVITVFLVFIVTGFAVTTIGATLSGMQANAALSQTVAQLRQGREAAVAQRRDVRLIFANGNEIQLVRMDEPAGMTTLSTIRLANGVGFRLFNGIPDTPDSFGQAAPIDFGGAGQLTFMSDGTLVDAQGDPLSGTVFLGLADHPETARAVTILGSTGRVRGYKWTGSYWVK
jgi:Tfp pilus assembly protein FimT